ncbi:helix-turn-helix transcriptional regulator [Priestia megaterium]|uniref:helix-turn-helix domain-containing protein n=1 Tax=Priestia megaterium TaxID=1404 RepID=UPI002E202958|nr:helix-turn-helix transcriptional regulator [Priestia megaterium]
MEVKKCFGLLLRKRRREKKFSQQCLADKAGLDRTYISLIERGGRSPTLTTLYKLSNALECETSELIRELEKDLGIYNIDDLKMFATE